MAYRVGFASIDGTCIDQHFGSARYWQIYDIGEDSEFVETRKTVATCAGHCQGGFDRQLEVLRDCDALFVGRIGQSAAAFLLARGKRVFEAQGSVEDLLVELIAGNWLEETDHGSNI